MYTIPLSASKQMINFKSKGKGDSPQARAYAYIEQHGGVIFSSDHGKAKQFWVAQSRDAAYNHIFSLPPVHRVFYETIPSNTPCKLFYDLELDNGNDDGVPHDRLKRMDTIQRGVIETSIKALKQKHNKDVVRSDIIVLYSDGNGKASRHIIIPVFFAGVEHVKAFVHGNILPAHEEWVKQGIDPGVYTKNRQFRLLGCRKLGTKRVLRMEYEQVEVNTPEHRRTFMSSLICEPPPADTTFIHCTPQPKRRGEDLVNPTVQRRRLPPQHTGASPDVAGIQAFLTALIQEHEDAYVANTVIRDNGSISFTCRRTAHTKPCRFGGTHSSNHFAVSVYPDTGKILYSCFGSLGHHPRNPDGSLPQKGEFMILPETLPTHLRTANPTPDAEVERVRHLMKQAEEGDVGFAKVYFETFGRQNLVITSTNGTGYMWDDNTTLWREVPKNLIINSIQRVLMELYIHGKEVLLDTNGDGETALPSMKSIRKTITLIGRHNNLMGTMHQLCDTLYDSKFKDKPIPHRTRSKDT